MPGSYTVVKNIDGFLSQVVRLAGSGYYFYFSGQLKPEKDPHVAKSYRPVALTSYVAKVVERLVRAGPGCST